MARQLRLDAPGLTHHITSRGNDRQKIFRDDTDCLAFIEMLAEAVRRFDWSLESYSLVVNHYHLVVQTPRATLSNGMQWLNGKYAQWFNRRHGRTGHLFQGRFHSFLVDSEAYLMEVTRYVELNAVRAGLVARPEEYRWSSYRATAGFEPPPDWLSCSAILSKIREDPLEAQQVYRDYVSEKLGDDSSIWDQAVHQIYFGRDTWIETMRELVESQPRSDEHPQAQRMVGRAPLHRIVEVVASVFDIDPHDLRHGRGGVPRMIVAWLGRYESASRLRPVAAALRLQSGGTVSALIEKCERELNRDEELRAFVDRCLERLRGAPGGVAGANGRFPNPYWPALPLPAQSGLVPGPFLD